MSRWIVLVLLVSSLACSQRREMTVPTIEKEKIVAILVDVHLLEAQQQGGQLNDQGRIFNTIVGYEKIFHKHGVTSEQFYDAFTYYKDHPQEMDDLYQQVIDRATRDESKISSEASKERLKESKTDTTKQGPHSAVPHVNEW